ncbi:MAG: phosphatase PAP2 family protein [Marmoricola sp.]|nr:phosphatase PAP2 family protein [Marmoricola sp.]
MTSDARVIATSDGDVGSSTARTRSSVRASAASWIPLVLVTVLGTVVVGALADAVREHEGVSTVDPQVADDMVAHRTGGLTVLAHVLTFVGSEVVVAVVAAVILAGLVWRRSWDRALVLAVAVAGAAVLTFAIKLLVARSRPGAVDRLGPVDTSYSFPSGHTLNSAVLIGVVCWLLWPAASWTVRAQVVSSAALLTAGIAFSRVYLGYHWFTDVLASVVIAVTWLSAVMVFSLAVPHLVDSVIPRAAARARPRIGSQ